MPPSPPNRNVLVERCSSLRGCEPCKRRKRVCNGQRPCGNCQETNQECVYSVVSDYSRSVFTTNSARRLSSGSACETCRRRKTKCDGGNPCAYCVNAGFECNNNSERRKRAQAHAQAQQQAAAAAAAATSGSPSTSSTSLAAGGGNNNNADDHQAMDRIEDRLRRIEKLMTAFTPSSPLSRSSFTASSSNSFEQQTVGTIASRKLSSPHPPPPSSSSHTTTVRQHRHSVQGISVAKEQAALRSILKGKIVKSNVCVCLLLCIGNFCILHSFSFLLTVVIINQVHHQHLWQPHQQPHHRHLHLLHYHLVTRHLLLHLCLTYRCHLLLLLHQINLLIIMKEVCLQAENGSNQRRSQV